MTTSMPLTRRTQLASALAGTTVVALPAGAEALAPRGSGLAAYQPRSHHGKDKLLSRADRHLVTRFSYGITPKLAKQVRKAGGGEAWFEAQLRLARRKDRKTAKLKAWWPSLSRGPADLWTRQIAMIEHGGTVMRMYARWVLMRRLESKQQLLEVMTEFWENHFNIAVIGDQQFTYRVDYGETIRKHALGSFEDLLRAAVLHPAMLIYLDASESTKAHPNENLGRELLELHTVGVENYKERDVLNSARILTGWSVDMFRSWVPEYLLEEHWTGKVHVKGFKDKNRKAKGKKTTRRYLKYLAHHPDTAERIAKKLVLKFVNDKGNKSLVRHLAKVYLENDTQIVPVLRALIESKQFKRSVGDKLRDPGEDTVATYRALGVKVAPPVGPEGDGTAISLILAHADTIGIFPFNWPQPDGQPIDNDSWTSAGRALGSLQVHWGLANQTWPRIGASFRPNASWLPAASAPFAEVVDYACQQILHRHSTRQILKACCTTTGLAPEATLAATDPRVALVVPRMLATILDTPEFMSR